LVKKLSKKFLGVWYDIIWTNTESYRFR
jgi:hypothetical protein